MREMRDQLATISGGPGILTSLLLNTMVWSTPGSESESPYVGTMTMSPQEFEQAELALLEQHYQETCTRMQSLLPTGRPAMPQEIAQAITFMQDYETYFRTFETAAQSLQAEGLPQLAQRLNIILGEGQRAKTIYAQMYQSTIAAQQTQAQIWRNTNQEILNMQLEANRNRQAVFDQMLQKWHSSFLR